MLFPGQVDVVHFAAARERIAFIMDSLVAPFCFLPSYLYICNLTTFEMKPLIL